MGNEKEIGQTMNLYEVVYSDQYNTYNTYYIEPMEKYCKRVRLCLTKEGYLNFCLYVKSEDKKTAREKAEPILTRAHKYYKETKYSFVFEDYGKEFLETGNIGELQ